MSHVTQANQKHVKEVTEKLYELVAAAFGRIPDDWSQGRVANGTSSLIYWQEWIAEDTVKWPLLRRVILGWYSKQDARNILPNLLAVQERYRDLDPANNPDKCRICGDRAFIRVPCWVDPGGRAHAIDRRPRGRARKTSAYVPCICPRGVAQAEAMGYSVSLCRRLVQHREKDESQPNAPMPKEMLELFRDHVPQEAAGSQESGAVAREKVGTGIGTVMDKMPSEWI